MIKEKISEVRSTSLSYIQMAITNFRLIEITYTDQAKETTRRRIEPLAIYSYDEKWIVIGWCQLREDYRSFRLDRIQHFKVLEQVFEDRKFDLRDYFSQCEEIGDYP
ncbi:MAG: WYL domain-containing protein [Bacteroidota bacterium]